MHFYCTYATQYFSLFSSTFLLTSKTIKPISASMNFYKKFTFELRGKEWTIILCPCSINKLIKYCIWLYDFFCWRKAYPYCWHWLCKKHVFSQSLYEWCFSNTSLTKKTYFYNTINIFVTISFNYCFMKNWIIIRYWNFLTFWALGLFGYDCRLRILQINLFVLFYKTFGTKVMLAFHGERFSFLVKKELTFIARTDHLNRLVIINLNQF